MIDLAKVRYRVVVVTNDGTQYDVTDICSALGWSEGEKELSAKITCKLAVTDALTENIQPMTPIFVYADMGAGFEEVIRGNVQKLELTETNGEFTLNIESADECRALRANQDDMYFTDGHSSSAILGEILSKWGVPHEIRISDGTHAKKVYRKKYLCDMVQDVLTDLKEKDGGTYFIRAKGGVIEIIPRGTNETIYHFDIENNLVRVRESFDASKVVTRVQVVAKSKDEGHQKIESTVDGKTEYGVRQIIYTRGNKETLAEAETAAKKILEEQGDIERKTSIEAPDIPTLRKGDRIRVRSSAGEGYFFVKSIRHSAPQMKMTLELDEDKDKNKESGINYDTGATDESNSSSPP